MSTYYEYDVDYNNKDPKFKVGNHVRISKKKNIVPKAYTLNWSEKVFVVKKVRNIVPWKYVINVLNDEQNVETFYKKELQKTSQKEFRIEKVIKRKDDRPYTQWKDCDNSFNSCINIEDIA